MPFDILRLLRSLTTRNSPSTRTAQDAFRELMRSYVGPALRELGLRGTKTAFYIPDPASWATIGFQSSVYNDRSEVKFTANLTVANKAAWDEARRARPWLPVRPAPNVHYGDAIWQDRIGMILPVGEDKWWAVRPNTDLPALSAELVGLIEQYAIPTMRARLAESGLRRTGDIDQR
jgi:hypothetical protein